MNANAHRLVFDRARGMCVAVAESVRTSGKPAGGQRPALARRGVALFALGAVAAASAQTLPAGGEVVRGAGRIHSDGAAMVVQQDSARMVTDWRSFSIGAGASVRFVQPAADSVALNRVLGSDASQIFGSLSANGHVYLQNPNGVLFAPGARVDVGSLVATTLGTDLNAFMQGRLRLAEGATPAGAVVNQGELQVAPGGLLLLAGPQVDNQGNLSAPGGTVALAAGRSVHVDATGAGLLEIRVPEAAVGARLAHSGRIDADGGAVSLQVAAADAARDVVLQVDGLVRARRIENRGGQIVLAGGDSGIVQSGALLDASGSQGAGGQVHVLGERVALTGGARLDASGDAGGGQVLVGGAYQGRGPQPNAKTTRVAAGVTLDASATARGDGGEIVVWSDGHTAFRGQVVATGGAGGGDGGLAEVSGKQTLDFRGGADLRAAAGRQGRLLLDPASIVVGPDADVNGDGSLGDDLIDNLAEGDFPGQTSHVTAGRVAELLATTDVDLQASFDISVVAPVTVAPGGSPTTLTLDAPFVTISDTMALANASLSVLTNLPGSDSVQLAADISTNNRVDVVATDIFLSSGTVSADTLALRSSANGSGNVFQCSCHTIAADQLVVGEPGAAFGFADLSGSNKVGALDFDVNSNVFFANESTGARLGIAGRSLTLQLSTVEGVVQNGPLALRSGLIVFSTDPDPALGSLTLTDVDTPFLGFDVQADVDVQTAGSLVVGPGGEGSRVFAGGDVKLRTGPGGLFTLSSDMRAGGTIDIGAAGFVNSGGGALLASRFIIRSSDYTQDDFGGIVFGSAADAINAIVYNGYVGAEPASGNLLVTNQTGRLLFDPAELGDVSRPYDGTANLSITQFVASPSGASALEETGSGDSSTLPVLDYEVTLDGSFDDRNAGTDKGFVLSASNDTRVTGDAGNNGTVVFYGLRTDPYVRPAGPSATTPVSEVTQLSVAVTGVTADDKVYDATTAATLSGTPTVAALGSDAVGVTGTPTAAFADKNVGSAKPVSLTGGYSLTGADGGNYAIVQPGGLAADITQRSVTVTGVTADDKVYDATTVATLSGTPTVAALGSDAVGVTGTPTAAFADKNVGSAKPVSLTGGYSLTGADGGNYAIVQPGGLAADITQRSVTVTGVTADDKVYDATTVATLSGTPTVAALGSDAVSVTGTPTAAFADKNVGSAKPVTVTGGYSLAGADAGNYAIVQPGALSADITQLSLALSGVTAAGKVYDGTTGVTLGGTPVISPIAGDVVDLTGTLTGSFADKNAGTAKPVSLAGVALGGADAGNYALALDTSLSADITQLSVAVTGVTADDKVYDATTAATLSGTPTVAALGSDAVGVTGTPTAAFADKNVGSAKPVSLTGGYSLTGADGGNYAIVQPGGLAADITQRSVTVTGVTADDKVYDATTVATLSGTPTVAALGSDAVGVTGTPTAAFADKNVGSAKPVTVTGGYSLAGADAGNYAIVQPGALSADITQLSLALSGVTAAGKVYDGTTGVTLGGTPVISPIAGDVVDLTGTLTGSFADKNAGTAKPVSLAGVALGGADAGNYALALDTSLSADITQLSVAVTGVTADDKVYDATTAATLSGTPTVAALGSDAVGVTGTPTAAFADKNVGSAKPVSLTGGYSLTGADGGNYAIVQPGGLAADITQRSVTVTGVTADDKVYDATTVATLSGTPTVAALGSDAVSVTGTPTAAFADKNVGSAKPVTVTGGYSLAGADAGNYAIVQPGALSADITQLSLALSGVTAAGKVYDGTTGVTLGGTPVISPIAGDVVDLTGTLTGSFADKNAGTAKPVSLAGVALGGADAGNYALALDTSLSADITQLSVAVTGVTADDKVYDATTAATLSGTPTVAALGSDAVGVTGTPTAAFADKNVGSAKPVSLTGGYSLTGADGGNYAIVQPGGLAADITQRSVTVTGVTADDKVYDATTVATLSGTPTVAALGSDAVSVTGTPTAAFADKNVGSAKPVTVTGGYSLAGADAGNYAIVQPGALSADITQLSLALSGVTAAGKVYDGTTGVTLGGTPVISPIAGDVVDLTGTLTGSFADKNAGTAKPVSLAGVALGGADAGNYALALDTSLSADITQLSVAVTGVTADDKVYDATTAATLSGTPTVAALGSDAVSVTGTPTAAFADKNVGSAKPVSLTGLGLGGADGGNYTLLADGVLSADITRRPVTVSGVTAADKIYDGTTTATLSGTPTIAALGSDVVEVVGTPTASFGDKNVGTAKPVTVSGAYSLTGGDAANYELLITPFSGLSADIGARTLVPTGVVAINRAADGTLEVQVDASRAALGGLVPGEDVSLVAAAAAGLVATPDPGRRKPVTVVGLSLLGADARNYILSSDPVVVGTTVNILTSQEAFFEEVRFREYLQAVSDAQEPFRRAMAEALAAGFGKENIRKRLSLGLVFETGLAGPAVDDIQPAKGPPNCTASGAATLSCP